jgi:hypothetical protein
MCSQPVIVQGRDALAESSIRTDPGVGDFLRFSAQAAINVLGKNNTVKHSKTKTAPVPSQPGYRPELIKAIKSKMLADDDFAQSEVLKRYFKQGSRLVLL